MRRILICLMLVLMISSVAAADYTFKQNTSIDLKVPCFDAEDNPCVATALCNITILYPNQSVLADNQAMTYNALYYNYTIAETLTYERGEHPTTVSCTGSTNGTTSFEYLISGANSELTVAESIIYIVLLFGAFVLFGLCLYGSLRIRWRVPRNPDGIIIGINDLRYFKPVLIGFSYLILLYIVSILNDIAYTYTFLKGAAGMLNIVYTGMLLFLIPVVSLTGVLVVVAIIQNKKIMKDLERGFIYV